jgi:hypothetical protein
MTNGPYRKPQVVSFDHIEALHKQLSGAVNERFLCQRDMKRAARRAEALRKEATATETAARDALQQAQEREDSAMAELARAFAELPEPTP